MTQQNAALVEEAASASESMEEQAKGMMRLMEYFNVGEGSQGGGFEQAPSAPAAARRPAAAPAARKPASRPKPQSENDDEWSEF